MPVFRLFLAFLLLVALPVRAGTDAGLEAAQAVIASFDDTLVSTMKDAKTLGYQGRFDRLAPEVDKAFDLEFTTKLIIGSDWNALAPEKQAAMVAAFRKFTISTYANRFDGYNGEQIQLIGQPTEQRDNVRVQTEIVLPGGQPPVKLDYILHHDDKGWQIIDIFLQGTISQLATQRSEFQAVLKASGPDGLIAMLDKKSAEMASASPSAK